MSKTTPPTLDPATCPHDEFGFDFEVGTLGEHAQPEAFTLTMRVACADCGTRFRFGAMPLVNHKEGDQVLATPHAEEDGYMGRVTLATDAQIAANPDLAPYEPRPMRLAQVFSGSIDTPTEEIQAKVSEAVGRIFGGCGLTGEKAPPQADTPPTRPSTN